MYNKSAYRWLCGAIALSFAWGAQAHISGSQVDNGLIKVADVIDTDIRLGEGAERGAADVHFPQATFLRIHMVAEGLPWDGKIMLTDRQGNTQVIHASDVIAAGSDGYYAMSMDSDHLDVLVTDADGKMLEEGYILRVDKVDVGFRQIDEKPSFGAFAVIGADQRRPAVCYQSSQPSAYRRAQAVARTYSKGYLGTAWRVSSENRMLTNHHVMNNGANAGDFELWFGYEHQSCSGGATQAGVKVRGGSALVGDPGLDFQLFTIKDSDFERIRGFGHLGLDVGNLVAGEVIYIPQHGGGSPKQLAVVTDDGSRCRITSAPSTRGQYQCDTQGGSSGSPVIKANTGRAVVLHNSAAGSQNQGHRINAIWPKIQPYFAHGEVPQTSP